MKQRQLPYRSNLFLELSYFSVLTPYYTEEVLFSSDDLDKQNEDGVSILFYLQKIYPGLFVYLDFQDARHRITSDFFPLSVKFKCNFLILLFFHQTNNGSIQMNGTIFLSARSALVKMTLGLNGLLSWKKTSVIGLHIEDRL